MVKINRLKVIKVSPVKLTFGNSLTGANTFSVSLTFLPLDGGRLSGADAGNGRPLHGPWNNSVRIRLISKCKRLLLVVTN